MARVKVGEENGEAIELHYQSFGKGRPVVLIHGWPLSGRSWEKQIPALVNGKHRAIVYDRRGFGASSQPWNGYDYETLATDLNALLETLDLREATLVGFSMGGGEVARYLAKFGTTRVAQAVFAAAIPPFLYKCEDNPDGPLDDDTIKSFANGLQSDRAGFLDGFFKKFFAAGAGPSLISQPQHDYTLSLAAVASPKATLDCMYAFARTDFRADLKKCTVPTLILHGDSDGIVPFSVSGALTHQAILGSRVSLIKGGPHGCNVTHGDEFNKALLGFLAS